MQEIGVVDGVVDQDNRPAPATYHRGLHSIDRIFLSPSLQPINKGYLQFGYFLSDHQALWINLTMNNICSIQPPLARKLKSSDVRTSEKMETIIPELHH